ncbi:hypothetical protein Sjap_025966 [Stephania japonica]|uniref:NAC domain-containing protein n=1 Tax=Stephania japonica TaxID=461633 RepID=A0AAP0E2M0_9MAGN
MGYLQAKASNIQLPFADPNVEFDAFTIHPTQLHMQQRLNATSTHLYFYVMKSGRNRKGLKWVLACKHSATAILNRKREVIGYRSMLVYYNNALNTNNKKRDRLAKTKWILHEYMLPEAHNMSSKGHKVDVNDHNSSSEVVQEAAPRRIGSLIFPDQLNDDEAADDD